MNEAYLPTTPEGRRARVVEEMGECLQIMGKIGRFGAGSRHPDGGPTNAELLLGELNDLDHAIKAMKSDLTWFTLVDP